MPREIPYKTWQIVGMDLFNYKGSEHLLFTDYFSKYVEVFKLQSTDASSVCNMFSTFGIPEKVCSDNRPQFDNYMIKQFSTD